MVTKFKFGCCKLFVLNLGWSIALKPTGLPTPQQSMDDQKVLRVFIL
ncbi:hypothetical protein LDVICp010 [lymphocystis disease virus-China]|uniref:Uncharacterized protein n=1 Tax=lymphocystis disease virus-China TaxID=256729 RepID=Q678J9_9VIRU|nr:hypothetical protein LDVICp010 [lymphocystis disease virus-China]AAU10858.1 hypothetical protein [lymphocystis disease virus-China]